MLVFKIYLSEYEQHVSHLLTHKCVCVCVCSLVYAYIYLLAELAEVENGRTNCFAANDASASQREIEHESRKYANKRCAASTQTMDIIYNSKYIYIYNKC